MARKLPYPAAPWRLSGAFAGLLGLVSVDAARPFVPEDLRIVRVLPGYTLGAMFVARYDSRGPLTYSELGVLPAMVRGRGGRGFWISHLYVDTEASLEGHRDLWGLPQQRAQFEWTSDADADGKDHTSVLVTQASELIHMEYTPQPIPLPRKLNVSMLSRRGDRLLRWRARLETHAHKVLAEVYIPDDAPFADLRPLPSTSFAGTLDSGVITAGY